MKVYADENNVLITEDELRNAFYSLRGDNPAAYDYSFATFEWKQTHGDGCLREITDVAELRKMLFAYTVTGRLARAREIGKVANWQ